MEFPEGNLSMDYRRIFPNQKLIDNWATRLPIPCGKKDLSSRENLSKLFQKQIEKRSTFDLPGGS